MDQILRKLERATDSHKGENGKVAVIAGSRDYTGAPALSAKAALRTGCDLVKILTSEEVSDTVASYSENFIVREYPGGYFSSESLSQALELSEWADTVVIGPGMADVEQEAVTKFLDNASSKLVVDADALEYVDQSNLENAVLTPHSGEFKLYLEENMEELLEAGNVVLKKGEVDEILYRDQVEEIEVGTSAMTVGGTGDVLTGIVASLISQGLDIQEGAKLGAWINGKAGEKWTKKYGNGTLATDLIKEIPRVMNSLD